MRLNEHQIQELKDEWPIRFALERLFGWDCSSKRLGNRTHCPLCDPSRTRRADSFSFAHYWFHCFRCAQKGDVIKLVMLLANVKFKGAIAILEEHASGYMRQRMGTLLDRVPLARKIAMEDRTRARKMFKLEEQMTMQLTKIASRNRDDKIKQINAREAAGAIEPFEATMLRERAEADAMLQFFEIDDLFEKAEAFWRSEMDKPLPYKEMWDGVQGEDPDGHKPGNTPDEDQRVDRLGTRLSEGQKRQREPEQR